MQLASGRANDWILYETEDGRLEKITPNVFVRTFDKNIDFVYTEEYYIICIAC